MGRQRPQILTGARTIDHLIFRLKCLPLVRKRRRLAKWLLVVLEVMADDPAAPLDFDYLSTGGHRLLKSTRKWCLYVRIVNLWSSYWD